MSEPKFKIVVVGGGTAGWMTASALSLVSDACDIVLIESDQISTVGVGEATIPHIRVFNDMLGVSEKDFMCETSATYKLGIQFKDWGEEGTEYFHPFGAHGFPIGELPFHFSWLKYRNAGGNKAFSQFSLANVLAQKNRFTHPHPDSNHLLSSFSYAYHLDAGRYAGFLRKYSEKKGIMRLEGKVVDVKIHPDDGYITGIQLSDNRIIEGDLFVDCSGFRSILLGQSLGVKFQDWGAFLPCDAAVVAPSEKMAEPVPYTRSYAQSAGWQWKIPLQHRTGNGHVYSRAFMNDDRAEEILLTNMNGDQGSSPGKILFKTGMREKSWHKNCVAIGLSSGFLEPLESTSIYLIQLAIYKLMEYLPCDGSRAGAACFDSESTLEFNRLVEDEYEKVRDFLILHYKLNNRKEEFWRYCQNMRIPDSLSHKMELFASQGHVAKYENGLFEEPSWLAVYFGQGLEPGLNHPLLDELSRGALTKHVDDMAIHLDRETEKIMTHRQALENIKTAPSQKVDSSVGSMITS